MTAENIQHCISALNEEVRRLAQDINILEDRLNPVLKAQNPETGYSDPAIDLSEASSVFIEIYTTAQHVQDLQNQVRTLTSRVDMNDPSEHATKKAAIHGSTLS